MGTRSTLLEIEERGCLLGGGRGFGVVLCSVGSRIRERGTGWVFSEFLEGVVVCGRCYFML